MKLSNLIESLSAVQQEHGDLDVYVGFPSVGHEGRVDSELTEIEVEHYDQAVPEDKGLVFWGDPVDLFGSAQFQSAREYAAQAAPELLRLAMKYTRPTRDQDSDGDALMDIWQGWRGSLGIATTLNLSDLNATPAEVQS
jgi:hypothetical protein